MFITGKEDHENYFGKLIKCAFCHQPEPRILYLVQKNERIGNENIIAVCGQNCYKVCKEPLKLLKFDHHDLPVEWSQTLL